jgi:hypothetical protein
MSVSTDSPGVSVNTLMIGRQGALSDPVAMVDDIFQPEECRHGHSQ